MMKLFKLWLPVFVWAATIFYFSSMPYLKTDLACDFILRKIAHIGEYLILAFLLHNAFKNTFNLNTFLLFVYPTGIAILYAVSDELHQLFVPGRSCSARDVFIDSIGVFGFYILEKALKRK